MDGELGPTASEARAAHAVGVPALRLLRLEASGVRNLARLTFEPGPAFNVLSGENGAGKSNLLEVIVYACALESFRGARLDALLSHGADAPGLIAARLERGVVPHDVSITLPRDGARVVRVDGKKPRSAALHRVQFPAVIFHPADLVVSLGGPDARRALLDRLLGQMDVIYARAIETYARALRSRNRLLKEGGRDRRALAAFHPILASAGAVIARARADLVTELAPYAEASFAEITGEAFPLTIHYRPRVEPSEAALVRALEEGLARDLERGFTVDGPHGDDVAFEARPRVTTRHYASQGQHRALALALCVAELDVLARRTGRIPILLLDDVSSELDRSRNRRFFALLGRLGGQVFLTTTHADYALIDGARRDFGVEGGRLVPR